MYITIIVFMWSLFQTRSYLAAQALGKSLAQADLAGGLDNMFFAVTLLFFIGGPFVFYHFCKAKVNTSP